MQMKVYHSKELLQEKCKTHLLTSKGIACNYNMGGASGWQYTYDRDCVTCRSCLKRRLAAHSGLPVKQV